MRGVKSPKAKEENPPSSDNSEDIKEFFAELTSIKETVAMVKNSIAEIKSLHDRALNNVISEQENARKLK